jgi:carbonic anhydrase/acetyltransferase-like protein (isoleucine patch superfamily)
MSDRKYELTGSEWELTEFNERGAKTHIVKRIRRLFDGKVGGWIEKEENLSHEGKCWVDDGAVVLGDAEVRDDALVDKDAFIVGKVVICDEAHVSGTVKGIAVIGNEAYIGEQVMIDENIGVMNSTKITMME